VRIAFGARHRRILRIMVGQGPRLSAAGIVCGAALTDE
jgi:hypothetical protein